jgi:hypothetical protein
MVSIVTYPPETWKEMSEGAHLTVFGTHKPVEWERIDFAMVAINETDPLAYSTCKEHDSRTVYMQFGGAFPSAKGGILAYRAFEAGIHYLTCKYERIQMVIKNTNNAMLKMAQKAGFLIVGVKLLNNEVLVEHLLIANRENGK